MTALSSSDLQYITARRRSQRIRSALRATTIFLMGTACGQAIVLCFIL